MAHIIAFANQKGGVGKTMTVAPTASVLTQNGTRSMESITGKPSP